MIKKSKTLITVGCLLILSAMLLGVFNLLSEIHAQEISLSLLQKLDEAENVGGDGAVPYYLLDPSMDMPTVNIDGTDYVGTLSLPSLDIRLPVADAFSYKSMRNTPCRYGGSAYSDGFIICAHNYSSQFGELKTLDRGDTVEFTDTEGNTFMYTVEQTEVLKPNAVNELYAGDWNMTLFTCTVGGQSRVTVRCTKLK